MPGSRRSPGWRAVRIVTVVAGLLLLAVGLTGPAAAHATLVSSDPADGAVLSAAPSTMTFTFDETVSLPDGGVQVFDADGNTLDVSATARDAVVTVDLPDRMRTGTYVVTWRAVSGDGHPIAGSVTFSIGGPSEKVTDPEPTAADSPVVTAALSAVQGVGYVGLFLAAGLAVFAGTMLPRTVAPGAAPRRVQGLAKASALVAMVAAVLAIPLTVVHQQGLALERVLARTTWLDASTSAVIALLLLTLGFTLLGQNVAGAPTDRRSRRFALSGVALIVIAPALTGHTRASSPEPLVIGADILHVLAGSVWLGGLAGLALTLPTLAGRDDAVARTVTRFSTAAAGVLVAVAATGLVLAWRIVGSWNDLLGSAYGQILLVKLAVVLVVVALAGWNRFVLLPRARPSRRRPRRKAWTTGTTARVSVTIRAEATLLVAALLLTGFLVNRSPTVTEEPAGVRTAKLGDLTVQVAMTPGTRGRNSIRVQIEDPSGAPWELDRMPTLGVRVDDLHLGTVPVARAGPGACTADVVIPATGRVEVQVSLRRSRFENLVATLTFHVPGDGVSGEPVELPVDVLVTEADVVEA